ncbi:MAG: putative DNA-binding domain-containing protein [Gammaproteobacteria bacterium]|nr:putative DNA-binding domain-containing protein [Gammaproteobacteria bacterium]
MSALKSTGFIDTQYQFAAHLRDPANQAIPGDLEPRRMAIYQELFYNNIDGFIANGFPVIRTITSDDNWHAMIRDFMITHRCKTPLFHEVSREFLMYLENERDAANDPPFLGELAHYEWVELALSVLDSDATPFELAADVDCMHQHLKTSPLAWPLAYHYDVQNIGPKYQPVVANDTMVFLLVYRNQQDKITFIELNPVSARLIDLLNDNHTGQQAAEIIAQQLNHPNPQLVIDSAKALLEDWINRGIMIEQ